MRMLNLKNLGVESRLVGNCVDSFCLCIEYGNGFEGLLKIVDKSTRKFVVLRPATNMDLFLIVSGSEGSL